MGNYILEKEGFGKKFYSRSTPGVENQYTVKQNKRNPIV